MSPTPDRQTYETTIKLGYEGLIGESIGAATGGISNSCVTARLAQVGLSLKTLRQARRDKKTLEDVIAAVDWSFLERKQAARKKAEAKVIDNLNIFKDFKKAQLENLMTDIAAIKKMVKEIHRAYGL